MIPITFTADPLPADFRGTLEDFRTRFLINLRGTIADTSVLTGQVGGSKPTSNIGPWLNDQTWYVWNGTDYVPTTVKVGGANYIVQLSSDFTTSDSVVPDKTQILQDKDGTIALLTDVTQGRPVVALTTTTPTVNWALSHQFTQTLSGNTTYAMSNTSQGQEIWMAVSCGATPYTVTWPSYVYWEGGSAPAQSGANKTDVYILNNIGGSVFARQLADCS